MAVCPRQMSNVSCRHSAAGLTITYPAENGCRGLTLDVIDHYVRVVELFPTFSNSLETFKIAKIQESHLKISEESRSILFGSKIAKLQAK